MKAQTTLRSRFPVWALVAGLGVVVTIWLLRKALAPFFVAMVLAYLLAPPVRILVRSLKREWAVLLVLAGSIGILVLALQALVPRLVEQVQHLVANIPFWRTRLDPWLLGHPWMQAKLKQTLEGIDPMEFVHGLGGAGVGLLSLFLQAMTYILVPIIVYYLLMEGPELMQAMDGLVPPRYRKRSRGIIETIHNRLGGYIRGQIAVALAMSLFQGLAFQLLDVPYAWLLGLVAGVSNVVPYSPYITALPPALFIAGLNGTGWSHLLVIALVFTMVQKTETLYFTPVWVGRASNLHPLEVLLGILCFGFAFGVPGLIFAVPLTIVIKVVGQVLITDYKAHPWFHGIQA